MLSKAFLLASLKESVLTFVVTAGGALTLADGGWDQAVVAGAAFAGLRAVVGVLIKNLGVKDTPHL